MDKRNMKRLFYITRSFSPHNSGGVIVRQGAVDLLKKHFDVCVVTIGSEKYESDEVNNIVRIPYNYSGKLMFQLERLGILEDYLKPWANKVIKELSNIVGKNDIVFSTSGGELSCILAGAILKEKTNCKFVVNYHDPLIYSLVNGLKIDKKYHVSRESLEKKYLSQADLIVTSSKTNELSLKSKFPSLSNKICNNYFGYIDEFENVGKSVKNESLKFAYGGRFGRLQSPEVFAKAFEVFSDIQLYFIGNYKQYKPILPYKHRYQFIDQLSYNEYLNFLSNEIDVGLLSLSSNYLGACVPSKLYEYINLGIPMLGALPHGDAFSLINDRNYGISCLYNDVTGLRKAIEAMIDRSRYQKYKEAILHERSSWNMCNLNYELVQKMEQLK